MKNFLLAIIFLLAMFTSQKSYADADVLMISCSSVSEISFEGANEAESQEIDFAKDELGVAYAWNGDSWIPIGTYAGFDGTYHWIRVPISVIPSSPLDHRLKTN